MSQVTDQGPAAQYEPAPAPPEAPERRRWRTWWIVVLVLLLALGAIQAGRVWSSGASEAAPAPDAELPTAQIQRGTLTASEDRDGTITFADSSVLRADVAGRVTWLPKPGRVIERGRSLARIDERPMIAMYGPIPAYRALAIGSTGRDVEQLEANLTALGYTGFTVDETFTTATAAAVASWQSDVGVPATGSVPMGSIAFLPGPVQVGALAASVGDPVTPNSALYPISSEGRVVQVVLDEDDRDLAVVNAPVRIDAGSAGSADGSVASVQAVASTETSGQGGSATSTTYLVTVDIDPGSDGSAEAEAAEAVLGQAEG
ncbi:MAG TPA: peptidoglycan-binding protein, partial [Candidatus Limnocylindrales bacterium]|nr:peptidoglycan-binding protein [Candidatus Limnocylindrales bacterium]